MKKKHFMIDLETMGLRPNAAIVSIGVAFFDQTDVIATFYTPVSLQSCLDAGLTTTQSTVDWWAKQPEAVRKAWEDSSAESLTAGLSKMNAWMKLLAKDEDICPWGNGADFDLVLLKSAYEALDADPPWKYYNHHCFRTRKNLFGKSVELPAREGAHHHALDDAVYQAKCVIAIANRIGIPL